MDSFLDFDVEGALTDGSVSSDDLPCPTTTVDGILLYAQRQMSATMLAHEQLEEQYASLESKTEDLQAELARAQSAVVRVCTQHTGTRLSDVH